jgi:glycerate 2-kinase
VSALQMKIFIMLQVGRDVHHLMQDEMGLIKFGITKQVINDMRKGADDAVNRGKPLCIIGAGETIVNVTGSGTGGRNQELALAAAIQMHETMYNDPVIMKNFQLQFLSGATDGQDGPCDSAGALVDPSLVSRAAGQSIIAENYMDDNDSYNFFAKVDRGKNHIMTGLTGTNVMDLQVLLIWPHLWTSFERFDGMSRF